MKLATFPRGGVHIPDNKHSAEAPIIPCPPPVEAVVFLSQHLGAPAQPCVAAKDRVLVGSVLAKAAGLISAAVHSPVSGTVKRIEPRPDAAGLPRLAVVIAVEGDEWDPAAAASAQWARNGRPLSPADWQPSPAEIIAAIASCGIVGMGGATFPTHAKLSIPPGKSAEVLILDGVECEPYLTGDHRLMQELPGEVVRGAELLRRAIGAKQAVIGIEANKPAAIAAIRRAVEEFLGLEDLGDGTRPAKPSASCESGNYSRREAVASAGAYGAARIRVQVLKVKYPQGAEKQLIKAICGREVPSGRLPIDVGAVVSNVATAQAAYLAVRFGRPLVDRVVTIAGAGLSKPGNYLARIGTPLRDLIEFAGGMPADVGKVILGGPMMGKACANLDAPLSKGIGSILFFPAAQARRPEIGPCIRCGRCVSACPMGLEPYLLSDLSRRGRFEDAEKRAVLDCMECGSCSYICPSHRDLVDWIRLGKSKLIAARRKVKAV